MRHPAVHWVRGQAWGRGGGGDGGDVGAGVGQGRAVMVVMMAVLVTVAAAVLVAVAVRPDLHPRAMQSGLCRQCFHRAARACRVR